MLVSSRIILFDSQDMDLDSNLSHFVRFEDLSSDTQNFSSISEDDNIHQVDVNSQRIRRNHLPIYHNVDDVLRREFVNVDEMIMNTMLQDSFIHDRLQPVSDHSVDDTLRREFMDVDEMIMNAMLEDSFINDPIPLQPVSDTLFKQLPVIELDEDKLTKHHRCSICLEEFVSKEKVINLTCNHFYHEPCIFEWFQKQNMCPICKQTAVSSS